MFKERKLNIRSKESRDLSPYINVLIGIGFVVMSLFLVYNGIRSLQIANEKRNILKNAEVEVTSLRLKNISLLLEENKIETDDYTEIDIRNRLNYSKNGEVVFVISDQAYDLANIEVNRILSTKENKEEKKSAWEEWKELFTEGV